MPLGEAETSTTTARNDEIRANTHNIDVKIEPMTMKDIASVFELGNCIFTANEFPNMYRTWDDFTVVEKFGSSPEFCFVARGAEDSLVGFLLGETITKQQVGTRGYIQWVAVLGEYRRKGVATDLIQAFRRKAQQQNVSMLLADTPADNQPALSMFAKAGLNGRTDHVYLTHRFVAEDLTQSHVSSDGTFNYMYMANNKQRITIRNMKIQDLYPIFLIGEDIFTKDSPNLYNFWDEHLVLQSYLSDPDLSAVATVNHDEIEQVVGFCFGTTIEKPRSSWKYGYLVWLGCSRDCQGLGLASQLYSVMLELFALEKVRMLMIDTQKNNKAALGFFRKKGFRNDENHVYLSNDTVELATTTNTAGTYSIE